MLAFWRKLFVFFFDKNYCVSCIYVYKTGPHNVF